jgi:hypothetical protein
MAIKRQWKIGKGMKNTLPLHIKGKTPRRKIKPANEYETEEEQQPIEIQAEFRQRGYNASLTRMLDLAVEKATETQSFLYIIQNAVFYDDKDGALDALVAAERELRNTIMYVNTAKNLS